MASCNARGFLCVSHADMTFVKNIKEKFVKRGDGYAFYFSFQFDAFQNGFITNDKNDGLHFPVYLCNDTTKEKLSLGDTQYNLFPNTAFPLSFPYFHKNREKGSFLYIDCQEKINFFINYEGVLFKSSVPIQSSNPYYSTINVHQQDLYSFEKTSSFSPIQLTINYPM